MPQTTVTAIGVYTLSIVVAIGVMILMGTHVMTVADGAPIISLIVGYHGGAKIATTQANKNENG